MIFRFSYWNLVFQWFSDILKKIIVIIKWRRKSVNLYVTLFTKVFFLKRKSSSFFSNIVDSSLFSHIITVLWINQYTIQHKSMKLFTETIPIIIGFIILRVQEILSSGLPSRNGRHNPGYGRSSIIMCWRIQHKQTLDHIKTSMMIFKSQNLTRKLKRHRT